MNKCAISDLLSSVVCSNSNYSCIVCGRNICLAFALVIRIYFLFFFCCCSFISEKFIDLFSVVHVTLQNVGDSYFSIVDNRRDNCVSAETIGIT